MRRSTVNLALSASLIVLGVSVLVGWSFQIEPLKSVLPGLSTMKANTALAFVLLGAGLVGANLNTRRSRTASAGCGAGLIAIGAATLSEYGFAIDLWIDEALFADRGVLVGSGHPGRMSPLTAGAWITFGSSLIILAYAKDVRWLRSAHLLSAAGGFVGFFAAAAYAFGVDTFWGLGFYTQIAVHTALGLLVAMAAALLIKPESGWLSGYGDVPTARSLVFRLLPFSVALPLGVGFLLLLGSGFGLYTAGFAFSVFVPLVTAGLLAVVFHSAGRAKRSELVAIESQRQLQTVLDQFDSLNASLGRQVEERTREQKAALEELHEAQRLETLGKLTGGVAHDFNNLLTPILGCLDMLRKREVGDAKTQDYVETALHCAERGASLVQRLLAFGRQQMLVTGPVDVAQMLEGTAGIIRRSVGAGVDVVVELPAAIAPVLADQNQLELALLNLALNARDAMREGGVLRIGADEHALAAENPMGLAPGNYVVVTIADTGHGMSEEVLRRAIEPFYSTKDVGKGTGLGLSMVHGLAAQLGGRLSLESSVEKGTKATLWLPAASEQPKRPAAASTLIARSIPAGLRVLLVDDEEGVRASVREMLADLTLHVEDCGMPTEGLMLLDQHPFDLLITDFLMPVMTGGEMARRAKRLKPELPVLIITGYGELTDEDAEFPRLAKPFTQTQLAFAIASLFEPLGEAGHA